MPTVRTVVNIPNGAATTILASRLDRRYIIKESLLKADGSTANVPQGIVVIDKTQSGQPAIQLPAPSTTNDPGTFPQFSQPDANDASFHDAHGAIIANGPGVVVGVGVTAARPLCTVASATGTATAVEVIEIY
jgi:hypothetical protein